MNWEKIESKPYIYSLSKNINDDSYKLITYKLVAGGIDIIHFLTESEIENYQNFGIESLKGRISHMGENFKEYEIISWR